MTGGEGEMPNMPAATGGRLAMPPLLLHMLIRLVPSPTHFFTSSNRGLRVGLLLLLLLLVVVFSISHDSKHLYHSENKRRFSKREGGGSCFCS